MRGNWNWLAVCVLLACGIVSGGDDGGIGLAQSAPLPVRTLGLGEISAAAFSRDLRFAAFAEHSVVYLVETDRWTVVYTLEEHSDLVTSLVFSSDGRLLASGGSDKTVRIWDLSTGGEIQNLQGHSASVRCVGFSPDGELLASGAEDFAIKLWDVSTGRETRTIEGHTGAVLSIAFSPRGSLLASGSADTLIKLWDVTSGQELRTLHGHSSSAHSVAFSPDGSLLASAGFSDGTAKLWDVATGWEVRTFSGHSGAVVSVVFSPDGELIASGVWEWHSYRGYTGEAVVVWSVLGGEALARPRGTHFSRVRAVAFSQDGRSLAWAERDRNVGMLDVASRQVLHWDELRIGHEDPVWSVAFSPDGTVLASGPGSRQKTTDPSVILWDIATGREIRRLKGHSSSVVALAFSPNGKLLASGAWVAKQAKVWDVETGEKLLDLPHDSSPEVVAFSPDGDLLATGTGGWAVDGVVRLWDVSTGAEIRALQGHAKSVSCLAFSPDGRFLASGSVDKDVKLWMVETGWVKTLSGHGEPVKCVAFSQDGTRLISSDAKELIVWSTETGEQISRIRTDMPWYYHGDYPSVNLTLDRRFLVLCRQGLIRIFDAESGDQIASLTGHTASILAVAFSPSGQLLASGSDDRKVKLWDVSGITGAVSRVQDPALDVPTEETPELPLIDDFSATLTGELQAKLSWTYPGETALSRVVVRRKQGDWPSDHRDGILIHQNLNPAAASPAEYSDTDLLAGQSYYYVVFSCDLGGNWDDIVDPGKNAGSITTVSEEAKSTLTETRNGSEELPIAHASDIEEFTGGIMYATYTEMPSYMVVADYYDPDGRDDLKLCYLRLGHPSKPLTLVWNQSEDHAFAWAGEQGEGYLTLRNSRATEIVDDDGNEGYRVLWDFYLKDRWPEVESGIDFGVAATDHNGLESGWSYAQKNVSFSSQVGILTGRIVDAITGEGIRGAILTFDPDPFGFCPLADENGFLAPSSLPANTYRITAMNGVYHHETKVVTVSANDEVRVDFALFPYSAHTVTPPNAPSGPETTQVDQVVSFSTNGAVCSNGHSVEYCFEWGDGRYSDWSALPSASHSYSTPGTYQVRSQARCASDPSVVSEWSSTSPVSIAGEEMQCVVELREKGSISPVEALDVGEFFDIYVGRSSGNPVQVRFSSDESQDGIPTGEWTNWFDWDVSSGDWDASARTKAWSFAASGEMEVWAQLRDQATQRAKCFAGIYANRIREASNEFEIGEYVRIKAQPSTSIWQHPREASEVVHQVRQRTPAKILPNENNGSYADGYAWWYVETKVEGRAFAISGWCREIDLEKNVLPTASFTHSPPTPRCGEDVVFDARTSEDPDGEIVVWRWDLNGASGYTRSTEIVYYWDKPGEYSVTLEVEDDTRGTDRATKTISVKKKSLWEKLKDLFGSVARFDSERLKEIKRELRIKNWSHEIPIYDPDPLNPFYNYSDGDLATVLIHEMDKENAPGVTYGTYILDSIREKNLVRMAASTAWQNEEVLDAYFNDLADVNAWADTAGIVSQDLLVGLIEHAGGSGLGISTILSLPALCKAGVGLKALDNTFYRKALWRYFECRRVEDANAAFEDAGVPPRYYKAETKDYFESLWRTYQEFGADPDLETSWRTNLQNFLLATLDKYKFYTQIVLLRSAGELRVYDSQNRVTGLVNGGVKQEIPNSIYDEESKTTVISPATDSYRYLVVGVEQGDYGLDVLSIASGKATICTAAKMPIAGEVVHQYTIDWDALAKGEQGVSLEIDSEGDGSFEATFHLQDNFDGNSVSPAKLANPKGGTLLWLWILLGVSVVIIVTITIVIGMKRKSSWVRLRS